MRFFEPAWPKTLIPFPLEDETKIGILERLRKELGFNNEIFGALVSMSAAWQRQGIQLMANYLYQDKSIADGLRISAATLVLCKELEFEKKIVVLNIPILENAFVRSRYSIAQAIRDPFQFLTKMGVLELDDIAEMVMDSRGTYFDAPTETREIFAEIDSILGWPNYSESMPEKLSIAGLSSLLRGNWQLSQKAVKIRMLPYYEEYFARLRNNEEPVAVTEEYSKLLGVPSIQIVVAVKSYLDATKS